RRRQIGNHLRFRVFVGFYSRFGFVLCELLSAVVGVLDLFIFRIALRFPPISFGCDEEASRMVWIALLEFKGSGPRFVQPEMVSGIHRIADQTICSGVIIKSVTGRQQNCQNTTKHAFILRAQKWQKKSPRVASRGKVGWWRKSTYTTIDTW